DVQDKLLELVGVSDVIAGHALHGDLEALHLQHHRLLDTALLFSIKAMPKWTLSLKDLVDHVYGVEEEASAFQCEGVSHDSVQDATWAMRLALHEVVRVMDGDGRSAEIPSLPTRFLAQMQVRGMPDLSEEHLRRLFERAEAPLPETCSITCRAQCTLVEFPSAEEAKSVFEQKGLGKQWPDDDGFLCKSGGKGGSPAPGETPFIWLKSFLRISLSCSKKGQVDRSLVGKIIGHRGRRLREIRKQSGAVVVIKPAQQATDTMQPVEITAPSEEQVHEAELLMRQVGNGDRLGV
ncbi:hypothetical protein CYMTET_19056, partial [Cymbomonas tetramitiformis]